MIQYIFFSAWKEDGLKSLVSFANINSKNFMNHS